MKETATKAWAAALAGVAIALINLLTSFLSTGQADPMMIEALGTALGSAADVVIMAVVGWVMVYFAPRNKPIEE